MLTRQLTSSPSSLSALTSSNKRSFFPTRDILMDVSFFFQHVPAVFSAKSRHYYPPPPTTGTPEALMEQASASGTREALGTDARLSCGPCIVCWQEILSPSFSPGMPHALERAKRKWNHLELSGTIWNARRATGTPQASERPKAIGTREAPYPYSKMCELCELFVKSFFQKLSALSSRTAHS